MKTSSEKRHFKNFEEKPEQKSLKRTISSGKRDILKVLRRRLKNIHPTF